MFSGMLAGFLKVAAVALVTGGFAAGLYFTIQAGQGEDGGDSVQVDATQPASPTPTVGIGSPQPTLPVTPPPIDTSDWVTYASPLGFSIKYPSEWELLAYDAGGQPSVAGDHAVIRNPVAQTDPTGEAGGTPGAMVVDIRPYPGQFDPILFSEICELPIGVEPRDPFDGPPDVPSQLTIAGHQAVLCEGHDLTPAGLDSFGFTIWVEFPGGQVVQVASGAVVPTGDDLAVARAIVDSFSPNVSQ